MGGERSREGRDGDVAYLFTRHQTEMERLDIQHYALRAAAGDDYLAPVTQPRRILDVGCGTGQWAYDLSGRFRAALVVGVDLAPTKPPLPGNFRFVRGNLLQGLPLATDSFDFVHQRLLVSGVPLRSWQAVLRDLKRVTAPGGWLELVEGASELQSAGPATSRLFDLLKRLAGASGLDVTGLVSRSLGDYLREMGMTDVHHRCIPVPVGEWGGRVGAMMASDCRTMFTRLIDAFQARFGVSAVECRDLLKAMQREWEENQSTYSVAFAFGRKAD